MKIRSIIHDKRFKFSIVAILYILFVIWLDSYWWLLLLLVIFDIYITKKVHWAFWKKKGVKKQTKIVEWVDAIIFAVIAATLIRTFFIEAYTIPTSSMEKSLLVGDYLFVSKYHYGPRKPITPFAVPFTHHTMPFTNSTKAYSEAVQWSYERMPGLINIGRYEPVVFNFPEGDTVVVEFQNQSYYQIVRDEARGMQMSEMQKGIQKPIEFYEQRVRQLLAANYTVQVRPVDKRENYIKRSIGLPGDNIEIVDGMVHVNGEQQANIEGLQYKHIIYTKGQSINPRILQSLDISNDDMRDAYLGHGRTILPLTAGMVKELEKLPVVDSVVRIINHTDGSSYIFPQDARYTWNEDNYGPITVPRKGTTVELTLDNLPLYKRLITLYEGHQLITSGEDIIIDGNVTDKYTFAMD